MDSMEVIKKRRSVRNYRETMPDSKTYSAIENILMQEHQGPFGHRPWFRLLDLSKMPENSRGTLGAYGFIRGARLFIAGASENTETALADYGACFEKIILKLTEIGLGTCWLGGTFKKSLVNEYFTNQFGMKATESITAISPVGYPAGKSRLIDSALKAFVKPDQRKPWTQLFFMEETGETLTIETAGVYGKPLEAVRLAPSANNGQPWRAFKDQRNTFHFYLEGGNPLDIGIAMAHFEVVSTDNGLSGKWVKKDTVSERKGLKYIISWEPLNR